MMNKKNATLLLLLMCGMLRLWGQNSVGEQMSLIITDLKKGNTVTAKNDKQPLTPASIVKLITTATALEILGDDFQFKTEIIIRGEVICGTLDGDLVIKAGGDPTLGSAYMDDNNFLSDWTDVVKRLNISKINGDIVADVSIFDRQPLPQKWSSPDVGNYYAAGVYGLSFYDNTLAVAFHTGRAGSKAQITDIFPNVSGVTIDNRLFAEKGVGDNAYFSGVPYSFHRTVTGSIEAMSERFVVKADNGNPSMALLQALRDSLIKAGISVDGKLKVYNGKCLSKSERAKSAIFSSYSPKLSDIVKVINTHSHNVFAEYLLKYLSLQRAKQGCFDKGIDELKNCWKNRGVDVSQWQLYDGSGLTKNNLLTAQSLNKLLIYMHSDSRYYDAFIASFPVAGVNGTVRNLFKNTPLAGRAYLKSGSMAKVQCYAGYIVTDRGYYSIVVMLNGFAGKRRDTVSKIENVILEEIERYEKTPN